MDKTFSALGHNISISPQTGALPMAASGPMQGPIGKKQIQEAMTVLQAYKAGKANLEARIVENERWYKMRHWDIVRSKTRATEKPAGDVEPASAWLFSSLAAKHADAMDNFPEAIFLPREQDDEPEADKLTAIIPLVLERNDFEQIYSDAWWYKLKNGTVPYGVFWDTSLENGLGDIRIRKLDLLNIFWQPGVTDIQDSRNLFVVAPTDDDMIKQQYPWYKGREDKSISVAEYIYDDSIVADGKSLVVDMYYKTKVGGRTVLHYVKFVGDTLLYATENDPSFADQGLYDHGQFPIVFDVLFPEEGLPTGFGYIDVMREPQIYIDKLDQIIIKNALMAGKKRWMFKDSCGVNENEFADWSKDIIHVSGSLDEKNFKEIDVKPLDAYIANHRIAKIDEIKETSGNRDFSQGGTSGGVTAAAAIAALQESGNKGSRDMIKGSYRSFVKVNNLCVELIRQFYDEARSFRIMGNRAAVEYIQYSNAGIRAQQLPLAYPGAESAYRLPVFDIKVKAQRSNPFNRAAQNEEAKALYGAGFFNPQMADQALIALDMMDFEGKQKVVEQIAKNQQLFQMIQQMAMLIQRLTGVNPLMPQQGQAAPGGKSSAAQTAGRATRNATESYGERLAERAKPDVSRGAK